VKRLRCIGVVPLLLAVLLVSVVLGAWQWPVPVPVPTASFAEPVEGRLLPGMRFGRGAQPVYPVDQGEVIFVFGPDSLDVRRGAAPSTMGTAVVVEHQRGFRSLYAHLQPGTLPQGASVVFPEVPVGISGESGITPTRSLLLSIIDTETASYVNPMLLLPPLEDAVAPTIGELILVRDQRELVLTDGVAVGPGTYELRAHVYDQMVWGADGARLLPYRIEAFLNGQTLAIQQFDRLPLSGTVESVLDAGGRLLLGTIAVNAGRADLELVVSDFAGNQRVRRLRFLGTAEQ
jgi:hypothetical protein